MGPVFKYSLCVCTFLAKFAYMVTEEPCLLLYTCRNSTSQQCAVLVIYPSCQRGYIFCKTF